MHIVLINQYYAPDLAPTGQFLHDVARQLVLRGHAVTVLCSRRAYAGDHTWPPRETIDGVRVQRLAAFGFGRRSLVGRLFDYASFYLVVAAKLFGMRPRPGLILALTTPPFIGLVARLAALRFRCPHAHWVMDVYPDVMAAHGMLQRDGLAYRVLEGLTRMQFRRAALVLCLGPDMQAVVERYGDSGAGDRGALAWLPLWSARALAPWPAGTPNPLRAERGWPEREIVFMYSGNMGLGHRFTEFVAAARATADDRAVRWVFAGGGKRRARLEQYVVDEGQPNAQFLPYAPQAVLREHLCSADVLLASLDADWQGCILPSKFQSSLAVGRPLIFVGPASCAPAQWLAESGGGWVVAPDDVAALQAAVRAASDAGERRRRGAAARAYAEQHFDPATGCNRVCDRIEAACRSGRSVTAGGAHA